MSRDSYNISIVVIGYNTLSTLANTINSINRLKVSNHNVEVIYIDDGSTDGSYEYFESSKLIFKKRYFGFKDNRGRVAARSKAIEMASGDWLLFLNSNITVNPNMIIEYTKSISSCAGMAFSGCIYYNSEDSVFAKYLNHVKRGIKKYKNNEIINYQNFLFSNCMVKKSTMHAIPFNASLRYYGGEELDWAYRFNNKFPNMMHACRLAIGVRNNHPNFRNHLKKMVEFGATNFSLLEPQLQIDVIKYKFLLNNNIIFRIIFALLYILSKILYKLPGIGIYIVKIGLLSSVLRGFYQKNN